MPKLYGSVNNRFDENHIFLNEDGTTPQIAVGMGVTEFLYSDAHAYEVVEVIDANPDTFHIKIRPVKAVHAQNYNYFGNQNIDHFESNPKAGTIELENYHGCVCRVIRGERVWEDGHPVYKTFARPHHVKDPHYSLNVQREFEDPSF